MAAGAEIDTNSILSQEGSGHGAPCIGVLASCEPTCAPRVFLGTLHLCHLGEKARAVVSTDPGVPCSYCLGGTAGAAVG